MQQQRLQQPQVWLTQRACVRRDVATTLEKMLLMAAVMAALTVVTTHYPITTHYPAATSSLGTLPILSHFEVSVALVKRAMQMLNARIQTMDSPALTAERMRQDNILQRKSTSLWQK